MDPRSQEEAIARQHTATRYKPLRCCKSLILYGRMFRVQNLFVSEKDERLVNAPAERTSGYNLVLTIRL
jgi:hypothetical protein